MEELTELLISSNGTIITTKNVAVRVLPMSDPQLVEIPRKGKAFNREGYSEDLILQLSPSGLPPSDEEILARILRIRLPEGANAYAVGERVSITKPAFGADRCRIFNRVQEHYNEYREYFVYPVQYYRKL